LLLTVSEASVENVNGTLTAVELKENIGEAMLLATVDVELPVTVMVMELGMVSVTITSLEEVGWLLSLEVIFAVGTVEFRDSVIVGEEVDEIIIPLDTELLLAEEKIGETIDELSVEITVLGSPVTVAFIQIVEEEVVGSSDSEEPGSPVLVLGEEVVALAAKLELGTEDETLEVELELAYTVFMMTSVLGGAQVYTGREIVAGLVEFEIGSDDDEPTPVPVR
jgi:hypothetical protein